MMLTNKKQTDKFVLLCAFMYFISYITRTNYGAIISEMTVSTGLTKSALSAALTANFITYGTGQLISGYFGDRIHPKKLISIGLCTTVLMNFLIPFCQSPLQMLVVWAFNGFAQSFMWPPIIKLMSSLLVTDDYNRGIVKVSWGSSIGTMFVYLISPILIMVSSWKSVFLFCAVCGLGGLILWQKACPEYPMPAPPTRTSEKKDSFFSPLLLLVMLAIVCQGILRDGVTTWMPSYISETFHLSNEISILSGVILPIFAVICYQAASYLYRKKLNSLVSCGAVLFGSGCISALLLYLMATKSAGISILLFALLTGSMHGVNLLLVCTFPQFFVKKGRVSLVSGLLNSCTYIGSAISVYVFPLLSEKSGWSTTILLWVGVALTATIILCLCIPAWKKFVND